MADTSMSAEYARIVGETAPIRCLLNDIAARMIDCGESTAVSDGMTTLTYRQLAQRAGAIASGLRRLSVAPNDRIGLLVSRGCDAVAAMLAILSIPCTYVALDASYPPQRLGYMARDADLRLAIVDGDPPPVAVPLVPLSTLVATPSAESLRFAPHGGHQACYISYTSGSTGTPKGVALHHECLDNLVTWASAASFAAPDAVTAQYSPLSFDMSFLEIAMTLAGGGELVVVPDLVRRDPWAFWDLLISRRVQRLYLPYAALQVLAEAASSVDVEAADLQEIVSTGEQLVITAGIRKLFTRLSGCRLVNQYGPVEAHVVTYHALEGEPGQWPERPPIGTPISNCTILIRESDRELLIAGIPVGLGYIGNSADENRRFATVDDGELARRAYRTGDLADVSPAGLQYLGRLDDQIKTAGYRVEPAEVEAAILQLPGLRGVAAFGVQDQATGSRRLEVAVVSDDTLTAKELRRALAETLPQHMIPRRVHQVTSLPMTPSGKVDRAGVAAQLYADRSAS